MYHPLMIANPAVEVPYILESHMRENLGLQKWLGNSPSTQEANFPGGEGTILKIINTFSP